MENDNLIITAPKKNKSEKTTENREENEVLVCEKCKGCMFEPTFMLIWRKRMFHPELTEDGWAPVQTFRCIDCKHINEYNDPRKEFLYTEGEEGEEKDK